jgi:hypothetical protein
LEKAKAEAEALRKQLAEAHQVAMFQAGTASVSPPRMVLQRPGVAGTPPQPPAKPAVIPQTSSRSTPATQPPSKNDCNIGIPINTFYGIVCIKCLRHIFCAVTKLLITFMVKGQNLVVVALDNKILYIPQFKTCPSVLAFIK